MALVLLVLLVRAVSLWVLLVNVPDYGSVALLLLLGQVALAIVQGAKLIRRAPHPAEV